MTETSGTLTIQVTDEDGSRSVLLPLGETLLAALQKAGVPVGSVCGGQMSCGTCHVYLEDHGGTRDLPSEDERLLLEDHPDYRPGRSRLACQVLVTSVLKGQQVEIAPDM
jgi:ferredoxin, 2Fe-2S